MTPVKRKGIGLLILALIISLAVACAAPAAAPPTPAGQPEGPKPSPTPAVKKLEKVNLMTTGKSVSWINYFLGVDKGLYREEGLELKIVQMKSGLEVPALLNGDIDYSGVASTSFAAGLQGVPLKMLMGTVVKPVWHIYGAPGVESAADLKGKTVAVGNVVTADGYSTKKALQRIGLDPEKDVTYVSIPSGERLAALKARAIGAGALTSPTDILAREAGLKELIFTADVLDLPIDGLSTTDKKLKENRDQVKRAIRGTLKSLMYMRDQPTETVDFIAKELSLEKRQAQMASDERSKTFSVDGTISREGIMAMVEVGKASGAIKGEAALEKGYDFGPLQEAQKELGLTK